MDNKQVYKYRITNIKMPKVSTKSAKPATKQYKPNNITFVKEEILMPHLLEEEPTIPTENINICFVGGVSTGKSTILNAIFCEELTQCKIKRTTMVPTIYVENENTPLQPLHTQDIFHQIEAKNKEIIEKTEKGEHISEEEYKELVFHVGKLDINILPNSYVNVYDIPGLNDARTKDIYYKYLKNTFYKFNLVIFIVDIHSGLNTSDEIDIVNFITNHTRDQLENNDKKIYTLVVVNKADDMQLDEESNDTNKLVLTGELNEMYEQVVTTITSEFARKNIEDHLIDIIPLCAIDSYLYRMVQKHGKGFKLSPEQILKIGVNEQGKKFNRKKPEAQEEEVYKILDDQEFIDMMIKLSGFACLEKTLHKFLTENDTGKQIRIDNLLYGLRKLTDITKAWDAYQIGSSESILRISGIVISYCKIYASIKPIDAELYDLHMSEFVSKIRDSIERKMKDHSKINELLRDYDEIFTMILRPYCIEYYETEFYPEFIKYQVKDIIMDKMSESRVDLDDIISSMRALKRIDCFHPDTITTIFTKLLYNFDTNKIRIAEPPEMYPMIDILKECINLNINISKILRFLVISNIRLYYNSNSIDIEALLVKKMIYKKFGEIPIYQYLTCAFEVEGGECSLNCGAIYINGITDEMLNDKDDDYDLALDLFYLNYEKTKNTCNIIHP